MQASHSHMVIQICQQIYAQLFHAPILAWSPASGADRHPPHSPPAPKSEAPSACVVHALARLTSRHGRAGTRRQRLRRRGGGGFALQIVEPHLNGPGGEVPILFWSEDEQRMRALCGQGPAPALATPAYFRSLGLDLVPGIGLLPATVPGAFSAWLTLLRDYGTWELATCSRLPLPTPATDFHWCHASPRPSWRCRPCSATNGPARPRSGCAMAARRRRTPCSARPASRPPTRASWNRRPAGTAAAASRPRCISGTKASSPTRSTPTHAAVRDTTGQRTAARCASPTSRSGGPV